MASSAVQGGGAGRGRAALQAGPDPDQDGTHAGAQRATVGDRSGPSRGGSAVAVVDEELGLEIGEQGVHGGTFLGDEVMMPVYDHAIN